MALLLSLSLVKPAARSSSAHYRRYDEYDCPITNCEHQAKQTEIEIFFTLELRVLAEGQDG
jgi:hypothetical protein